MSKETIRAFLNEMRARNAQQIDAMELPEGTSEFIAERIDEGDADTLLFMLKLGYLMGLQTGYAAGHAGESEPDGQIGPLQA